MLTASYSVPNFIHSRGEGARLPCTIMAGLQLVAGTPIGVVTSTGLWAAYNPAAVTGEERCRGILVQTIDTTAAGMGRAFEASYIYGCCTMFKSQLPGIDDNAISDLGGKTITQDGIDLVYLP